MLDYFAVFTRGGALLWTLQFAALRHNPIDAINALIRTCLLEERSSDSTFFYAPKTGAQQAMKWSFHNGLGLIFVAVYQKSLSLLYIDDLLAMVKAEFASLHQSSGQVDYKVFGVKFQRMLRECESRADVAKKGGSNVPAKVPSMLQSGGLGKTDRGPRGMSGNNSVPGSGAKQSSDGAEGDAEEEEEDGRAGVNIAAADLSQEEDKSQGTAFDVSKIKNLGSRPGAKGKFNSIKKETIKDEKAAPKKKADRKWDTAPSKKGSDPQQRLDFSESAPSADHYHNGVSTDGGGGVTGASDSDASGVGVRHVQQHGVSHMDLNEEEAGSEEEEEQAAAGKVSGGAKAGAAATGVLGSFLSRLKLNVVGSGSLTAQDLESALNDMKKRLMERNVAEGIAASVCASVGRSLEGQKLASFTGVAALVRKSFEESLSGILYKRQVDVLLDIRKAQERGKPYVIVFCGVNGVGKSTNLAKIAYWLGQHGVKVTIAACDTFRAGAVEQLKTHCARLGVPLYERGYEKDPAKVAFEAVKQAERDGRHVVLVDTAGRMQDNEPLMRALSNLIAVNEPQLVLFVGEALVGNDAVDQLTKFNRALLDLAPADPQVNRRAGRGVDGIVLTKFDTIDEKVGAAVSMVYSSGAPIMFVGCGQTYVDLKKLNVKSVVNSLLK
ncbi:hypothetical protein CEUSTIGMA_g5283.t1 [Chlamydomonas eustigma]|uniref:SRP54-type proteins GTP-binding domain-containing protein n=1 Tax=Chlamydomonas eustigma TaxID=1157962 RepID=A0A250X444_9CHLO|nr:hypothetical protein CEUSTIGMA_g5283.t1 [Chlamydomonas eustigma]|eukprot:GAX77841.1 hypothetical protein CEUSTIGMA_g5283.t1 [Chlamydomonas eustigma]